MYKLAFAVQAFVFILLMVIIFESVSRQLFYGLKIDNTFFQYAAFYILESCYFMAGYVTFTRVFVGKSNRGTPINWQDPQYTYSLSYQMLIFAFVLLTIIICITVQKQLFYRWDSVFFKYIALFMLEACYFVVGYMLFARLLVEKPKGLVIFLSFCLAAFCAALFLYKGLKGAATRENAIGELIFATHPFVIWFTTAGLAVLLKMRKKLTYKDKNAQMS